MTATFAFIGFGEAGTALAGGVSARGYDRKTDAAGTRTRKLADFIDAGVAACADLAEGLTGATAVFSLVTTDQSLAVAQDAARAIAPGTVWFDMNSVAPDTKRAAAAAIEAAGGRYVDVAVMSPVLPARRAVPLLVGGPHADEGAALLAGFGFTDIKVVPGPVGAASSIKMIRSVMIKGLEALTTECFFAADAAGVGEAVRASLDANWPGTDCAAKADYNLDRMMIHGLRRAAEMREVVKTLDALETGSAMTRATVALQTAIGALRLAPATTLSGKIDAVLDRRKDQAA